MDEPRILDGKTLAKETRKRLKARIADLEERVPGAAPVILRAQTAARIWVSNYLSGIIVKPRARTDALTVPPG